MRCLYSTMPTCLGTSHCGLKPLWIGSQIKLSSLTCGCQVLCPSNNKISKTDFGTICTCLLKARGGMLWFMSRLSPTPPVFIGGSLGRWFDHEGTILAIGLSTDESIAGFDVGSWSLFGRYGSLWVWLRYVPHPPVIAHPFAMLPW